MSGLLTKTEKTRELTPKQEAFLEALLENGGNFAAAIRSAGYSPNSRKWLSESLREQIIERARDELALGALRAANTIVDTMVDDGTIPKGELRLKAAESLLDRIGVGKSENINVQGEITHGVVYLPAKDKPKIIDHEPRPPEDTSNQ